MRLIAAASGTVEITAMDAIMVKVLKKASYDATLLPSFHTFGVVKGFTTPAFLGFDLSTRRSSMISKGSWPLRTSHPNDELKIKSC